MIVEKRFSYNPYSKDFLKCSQDHALELFNRGKTTLFKEYIRGIIFNNVLYLRLYYPFDSIDDLTRAVLYQASYMLLNDNTKDILKLIKIEYNITILDIKYNVDNDLLKGLHIANI